MLSRPALVVILAAGALRAASGCNAMALQQSCMQRIVDSLMSCRFESALAVADSLRASDTADPAGPFFGLCIRSLRDVDRSCADDSAAVMEAYRETMRRIEACRSAQGNTARLASLEGLAKAVYSGHCLNGQKYSPGVSIGLQALRILKEVKESHPRDFDADFILGMYDYGKAELRQRFWWVLFWYPGTKQRGIAVLERCSDSATFAARAADLALCDIYTKEERFDHARARIAALSARYPQSRFVLWSRAKYYEATNEIGRALDAYSALAADYGGIPEAWRNHLHTNYKCAKALAALGRTKESSERCRRILNDCRDRGDAFARSVCKETRDLLKDVER